MIQSTRQPPEARRRHLLEKTNEAIPLETTEDGRRERREKGVIDMREKRMERYKNTPTENS